jgi:nicotinamide-nucleotide amidase
MTGQPSTAAASREVVALLTELKLTIATAESCTGGLLAAALTGVPGASETVYGGFITYANSAKTKLIGVPARLIRDHGAVSSQVARTMAEGARSTAQTSIGVGITGIAGPTGGTEKKPVGLVYVAVATADATEFVESRFGTIGRDKVRAKSVDAALALLLKMLSPNEDGQDRP